MTVKHLKFLDFVLQKLSENYEIGDTLDSLAYYYEKETGNNFPEEHIQPFEDLYEGTYFKRISNVGLMVITPWAKDIIDTHGSLSKYRSIIDETQAREQSRLDNKEQLATKIAELTEINLTLQNKQLRTKMLFSIIGFILGVIATNWKEILTILKIISPPETK